MQVYRIGQPAGQAVPVFDKEIGIRSPAKFSSEFFTTDVEKPPLLLCPQTSIEILLGTVINGLNAKNLSPIHATNFLFEAFNLEKAKNESEWKSFGRLIAAPQTDVRLENLFSITRNESPPDYHTEVTNKNLILRAMIIITTIYRLNGISRDDYKTRTMDGAARLLTSIKAEAYEFQAVDTRFLSWNSYTPFRKVIAGIDMFLHRFPDHKYALCRYGTIVSRLKDCAILSELNFITESMKLTLPELSTWIWTEKIANQFDKVLKGDQEIDNPHSYAMYTTELGLSPKSPWSASMSPDLHFWIHVLGATRKEQRSINARIVGTVDKTQAINTAMMCAYVFETETTEKNQYHTNADLPLSRPKTKNAFEWIRYFKKLHGEVPVDIQRSLAHIWKTFTTTRDGTIGRHLYEEANRILSLHPN